MRKKYTMIWLVLGLLCAWFNALYHIASKRVVKDTDPVYLAYIRILFFALLTLPLCLYYCPQKILCSIFSNHCIFSIQRKKTLCTAYYWNYIVGNRSYSFSFVIQE